MSLPAAGSCRRCRAPVIEVLTESGFDVALDPEPLTPLGELLALVAGRGTYTRHAYSGAVFHRPPATIRTHPAGATPRRDVLAGHACTPTPTPTAREATTR